MLGGLKKAERVRDVLRGTIHMDHSHLENLCYDQSLVDIVADQFPGRLLQVKNRFIQQQLSNVAQAPDKSYDELQELTKGHWFGRDFFYRDLQFLVVLDGNIIEEYSKYQTGMDYVPRSRWRSTPSSR